MAKIQSDSATPAWAAWLVFTGLLAVAAGTLMPILGAPLQSSLYKIIFSAGALLSLAGRCGSRYRGSNMRLKRLLRLEGWSSVFFCVAAGFMWWSQAGRDWIAFTLAGGVVLLYTSIMVPRATRKG